MFSTKVEVSVQRGLLGQDFRTWAVSVEMSTNFFRLEIHRCNLTPTQILIWRVRFFIFSPLL